MKRGLKNKTAFFACLFIALIVVTALMGQASLAVSAEKQKGQSDFKSLEGRWTRPDGGYVLELKDAKKDGSISAAYYNPRPVKVFRAEAGRKGGTITLYVELRDINYPGSKYNLVYDAKTDHLRGTYFQAVERRTFDVLFVRMK